MDSDYEEDELVHEAHILHIFVIRVPTYKTRSSLNSGISAFSVYFLPLWNSSVWQKWIKWCILARRYLQEVQSSKQLVLSVLLLLSVYSQHKNQDLSGLIFAFSNAFSDVYAWKVIGRVQDWTGEQLSHCLVLHKIMCSEWLADSGCDSATRLFLGNGSHLNWVQRVKSLILNFEYLMYSLKFYGCRLFFFCFFFF